MKTKKVVKADPELKINRAVDDPHGLARSWLTSLEGHRYGVRVVHHRDEYLLWDRDAYRAVPVSEVRKLLAAHAERMFVRAHKKELKEWVDRAVKGEKPPQLKKVGTRLVGDVLQALAAECHLSGDICPPTWITDAGTIDAERVAGHDPRTMLATPGGVLDLLAASAGGEACLSDPSPKFFTRAAVGYGYSETAYPLDWLEFLYEVFGVAQNDDHEEESDATKEGWASIRALRQWFGYLLTADTSQQKILMLLGRPRSGKGTIVRTLTKLLGEVNVHSIRLEDLSSRFGLFPLRDKTLGVISDLRLSERADRSAIVERLLSVSGEDAQPVEQKHRDQFNANLPTRFVIVSNEVPHLVDASAALASRLVVIRTATTFAGKEDTDLKEKLSAELPGILNWALGGLADLHQLGRFTQPKSAEEDLRSLQDMAAPVGAFLRDRCKLDPAERTETRTLFDAYLAWCKAEGRRYTPTSERFGRDLRANAAISTVQVREKLTKKRRRYYLGIQLLPV